MRATEKCIIHYAQVPKVSGEDFDGTPKPKCLLFGEAPLVGA